MTNGSTATPAGAITALTPFLESADGWVVERACATAAQLAPNEAIPILERLAVTAMRPNVPIVCLGALRRMASADAALDRLRPLLPHDGAYFPRRRHG